MIQHNDFWDTITKDLSVFREGIAETYEHSIILSNGFKVTTSILLCGTGWVYWALLTPKRTTYLKSCSGLTYFLKPLTMNSSCAPHN